MRRETVVHCAERALESMKAGWCKGDMKIIDKVTGQVEVCAIGAIREGCAPLKKDNLKTQRLLTKTLSSLISIPYWSRSDAVTAYDHADRVIEFNDANHRKHYQAVNKFKQLVKAVKKADLTV